ncbi:hypothetical protein X824_gp148 [Escherichia phage 4MG]|uniref:Hyphothetical protein n=1 Tax=Escherichia phage 4MG TaxID=1391428 RepID=V5KSN9_9CAUD|nr:hypothetical protein X824_gp148 [Escherichia phage 4MG]AGZ17675.1 hyphothetical protein [Escherichia phage 4MG]
MLKKDSSHKGLDEKSYHFRAFASYSLNLHKNTVFIHLITCVIIFGV